MEFMLLCCHLMAAQRWCSENHEGAFSARYNLTVTESQKAKVIS